MILGQTLLSETVKVAVPLSLDQTQMVVRPLLQFSSPRHLVQKLNVQ